MPLLGTELARIRGVFRGGVRGGVWGRVKGLWRIKGRR